MTYRKKYLTMLTMTLGQESKRPDFIRKEFLKYRAFEFYYQIKYISVRDTL